MQMIWDPLRKKEVALTAEEKVRQSFIAFLHGKCGVPFPLMNSEVAFDYGRKHFRADIVVFGHKGEPLMVVECKNEQVRLGALTARQALRYHAVLNVEYIVLTNGKSVYIYRKGSDGAFSQMDHFPVYEEMLLCADTPNI